ncbi:MAG: YtxH domain-containing protein [Muribaculaceae bacterium]|nr:YtxH domain-containing protein [Muribaculaceae bacterium]MDE5844716.1 YtxH domain-containing protein [Muribaculaceae bacterium]MDE5857897.1 YtxH domain-containing protein [Muribaculaceae bacterium]MDE5969469.1 YtxH domain-containing protein [Muribaculaceae bacterium]MDE6352332.1 YtxH domain-containing protein [Muribaculaceae bacterium]
MKYILAFLGGAAVGAAAAILTAPEKGVETRARIKILLKKYGIVAPDDELEEMVDEIRAEIAQENK